MWEFDMKSRKVLRTIILKERGSVKHKSNSTENTQVKCITGTAQGDWGAWGVSTHKQTDQMCLSMNLLEYIVRVKSHINLTC